MPFTPAHAAAALPFRLTRLNSSALVVGCLSPDFEYFLRLAPRGGFGHTLAGVFVLDLPLGLLVLWLFHAYTKLPLWISLPQRIRARVPLGPRPFRAQSLPQFALLCLSIVIGAGTHILWDSFTHRHYWPSEHWPVLRQVVELPVLGRTPVYKLLQYASSIFGILVLILWWMRWMRNAREVDTPAEMGSAIQSRGILCLALVIAIGGAIVSAFLRTGALNGRPRTSLFLADAAVTAITLFFVEMTAYGVTLAIRSTRRQAH